MIDVVCVVCVCLVGVVVVVVLCCSAISVTVYNGDVHVVDSCICDGVVFVGVICSVGDSVIVDNAVRCHIDSLCR